MDDLIKKRNEFWETRVEGNVEGWQALRSATEADDATAVAILNAVGLKLVNRSLQMAYDIQGNKYDVPIFCLNTPAGFNMPKEKVMNVSEMKVSRLSIKLRSAGEHKDAEFTLDNNTKIKDLKDMFLTQKNLKDKVALNKIRLFFSGKEMKDDRIIAEFDVQNEQVVQVFIMK